MSAGKLIAVATLFWVCTLVLLSQPSGGPAAPVVYVAENNNDGNLDGDLTAALSAAGFTGNIEQTFRQRLEANLGRAINPKLADLGRMLWFDKLHSLHHDNTCGGCHSPTNGFGDSQSMAIGVQNNNRVGPHRAGPRNQRRSPLVVNTALYPAMMWNGRFNSLSGDPFDNSLGFRFPLPEDDIRFSHANDVQNHVTQLLQAQAHMPPTELIEVAGFNGTCPTLGRAFCQFDDGLGEIVPLPDSSGSRNEPIRQKVLALLNATPAYRQLFGEVFPEVAAGAPIDFFMFGKAIAEFEFTLVFANAPIDQFARGNRDAMTAPEKRGALLFFGKANCVQCHAVAGRSVVGQSNEMFTDFEERVIGVPQIAPSFGVGQGNVIFDGPGQDEDFGLEEITGNPNDRYKFRTAPLRNLAVAPGFFHNGAFTRLEDAIRHHLNVHESAHTYNPVRAGVPGDLSHRLGPIQPVLKQLDPLLRSPIHLTTGEFDDLVSFVRDGLLDERAKAENLCKLVPAHVPSGMPVLDFEACHLSSATGDPDISISASPTSATIAAGKSATYTLTITPNIGNTESLSLSCTGAPAAATCSFSPASVTLNGSTASTATATVTTMARSMVVPRPKVFPPSLNVRIGLLWVPLLLAFAMIASLSAAQRRRVWASVGMTMAMLLAMLLVACGGGGGAAPAPAPAPTGTPAGTYALTLTVTAPDEIVSTMVNLKVT